MCRHTVLQDVTSEAGNLLAKICLHCLAVLCRKCSKKVFFVDGDRPDCRCRRPQVERPISRWRPQ